MSTNPPEIDNNPEYENTYVAREVFCIIGFVLCFLFIGYCVRWVHEPPPKHGKGIISCRSGNLSELNNIILYGEVQIRCLDTAKPSAIPART